MRVSILIAALTVATFALASPSLALTCDEFFSEVQKQDTADLLPDFEWEPGQAIPDHRTVTNLKNIHTGMGCTGGEFRGFGASLLSGEKPDRDRWTALVVATFKAIAPAGQQKKAMKLAADLQAKAIKESKRNEIKTGNRYGTASGTLGQYDVSFDSQLNGVSFEISPRE